MSTKQISALSRVTSASRQYAVHPFSMLALDEYEEACAAARAEGLDAKAIASASWR